MVKSMLNVSEEEERALSTQAIASLNQRLRSRLIELDELSESSLSSRAAVDLDQSRVGRLSRMDAIQLQAMQRAAEERRELERQRIRTALKLIKDQEYGDCVRCGEEISIKRLQLDPSLITCVDCA